MLWRNVYLSIKKGTPKTTNKGFAFHTLVAFGITIPARYAWERRLEHHATWTLYLRYDFNIIVINSCIREDIDPEIKHHFCNITGTKLIPVKPLSFKPATTEY